MIQISKIKEWYKKREAVAREFQAEKERLLQVQAQRLQLQSAAQLRREALLDASKREATQITVQAARVAAAMDAGQQKPARSLIGGSDAEGLGASSKGGGLDDKNSLRRERNSSSDDTSSKAAMDDAMDVANRAAMDIAISGIFTSSFG